LWHAAGPDSEVSRADGTGVHDRSSTSDMGFSSSSRPVRTSARPHPVDVWTFLSLFLYPMMRVVDGEGRIQLTVLEQCGTRIVLRAAGAETCYFKCQSSGRDLQVTVQLSDAFCVARDTLSKAVSEAV
jgi:hypothetical protein